MPRIRIAAATALTALTAVALVGCASAGAADTDAAGAGTAASGGFPVTIEHAFGETVIESQPERVATVSWSNQEVPIALGVVPVGMAEVTWGDDDGDGVLPWVEEKLEDLGAETPVLFDETDGIDFEAVADTQPDVILAAYSGLTQEEYDTLSKIAPVVAYPEVAWGTSYEDMIRLNSQAIGLADEGEALIEELHDDVDAALANHPDLAGSTVLFSYIDPSDFSQIGFYTSLDTRPGFLTGLGLPEPAVVTEESDGEAFYASVSAEEADRFADIDVFVTYGDASGSIIAQLQADPLLSQIPAIAEGRIAILEESTPLAASANPSPLSIGWGVDEYFAILAGALG
ncbi:iron-siderophore ABC transporter substrate-binding protein [Microbacterium cremeum]|uniref:iron-siderophore ABC transporter substrate-binding protein n=1 Tax=Microbacterium cremeum TaxID=2782169 RepID=UPI001887DB13|nr:iron-siderophore ABC transporter substrate-binding protein [Microbacterium cremeum]